jgi:DNA-binding NarL/FixJ family response regulator
METEPSTGPLTTGPLSLLIAEDDTLLREGLARILTECGFEVLGQVENAEDLMRKVGALHPDVVIVDIRLPPTRTDEGLQAAALIGERHPEVAVLVLSQYLESAYATRLLTMRTRGTGYLLKESVADIESFTAAIRRIARGETVIAPAIVARLMARRREHDPLEDLTKREREILALMAEGRSNHAIGDALFISEKTVETHVRSILSKLGIPATEDHHRRVLAVLTYLRPGPGGPA